MSLCDTGVCLFLHMRIISSFIEYIFPKRDSFAIVASLSETDALAHYSPTNQGEFISLSPYPETTIRALIREAKFHHNEKAWALLALMLRKHFQRQNNECLVIPIPLSKERQKERGYNQVTEVLKLALKDSPSLKLRSDILYRKRDTKPQTSLEKKDRLVNVADAFSLRDDRAADMLGADIIIIDDVATTGATLKAARLALGQLKPKSIKCVALAH